MTAPEEHPAAEIKRHRLSLGLSQAELGERIGRSRMSISRYELDPSSPHHMPPPLVVLLAVRALRDGKGKPRCAQDVSDTPRHPGDSQ